MDDLDDLLAGGNRLGHGLAGCFFLDRFDKASGDGQGNVSFQQCDAHFAQGGADVIFGQRALFGQAVKDAREAVGKIFKHAVALRDRCCIWPIHRHQPPNSQTECAPTGATRWWRAIPACVQGPEAGHFRVIVGV